MDIELFKRLIEQSESQVLDFKAKMYDFGDKHAAFDMSKDIVSFYNTPREGSAYIVFGIMEETDGNKNKIGLDKQYDDADIQKKFKDDWVNLKPSFVYHQVDFDDKKFGVLEIPQEKMGICTFNKSGNKVQGGVVYYRNGSTNDKASGQKMTYIANWFGKILFNEPGDDNSSMWRILKDRINEFKDNKNYILLSSLYEKDLEYDPKSLVSINWSAVIDYNAYSESKGLLKYLKKGLEESRSFHICVEQDTNFYSFPGLSWFFANGLDGYAKLQPKQTERDWRKQYKKNLAKFLESCNDNLNPNPIVVVVLWSDLDSGILTETIKQFDEIFDDRVEFLCIDFKNDCEIQKIKNDNEDYSIDVVKYPLESLFKSLNAHFIDNSVKKDIYKIPESQGAQVVIDNKTWLWLSEDLEILHYNIGQEESREAKYFRQGAVATWEDFSNRYDCDRTLTCDLNKRISKDIDSRMVYRINLYYAPGSGGTTISRRIAWNLHKIYPVCILTGINPINSVQKIARIKKLSNLSVLVIIDKDKYTQKNISDLYEQLKAENTSAVLLQVVRRFEKSSYHNDRESQRTFWLPECLDNHESRSFYDAYSAERMQMKRELKLIYNSDSICKNAFLYGITAYDSTFKGLHVYVQERMNILSSDQKKVMLYMSMSLYYGHLSVHLQQFAEMLNIPKKNTVDIDKLFDANASSAKNLLIEEKNHSYRIVHQTVALEVMKYLLDEKHNGKNWKQNLSKISKDYINFCRGSSPTATKYSIDMVKNVFIFRENKEIIEDSKRYAQLIQDIPLVNGRIEVLRHLVEEFDGEAHFKAHLSRLLRENEDYNEALDYIKEAIDMQPNDHVLHHIKGIIYSTMAKHIDDDVDGIINYTKLAAECFEETRILNDREEYGYNSEIQAIVRMIDKIKHIKGCRAIDVLINAEDSYLRKSLETAEYLLDVVQYMNGGENPTQFTLSLKAQISQLYGNHSEALQLWDNMLNKSTGDKKNIRRQIVRVYLDRNDRNWQNINHKEIDRIIKLMESNIDEDVKDINSLKMWLQAIRQSRTNMSLDLIIEKISYWKANTNSLEASFYLYVVNAINAILKGSTQSAISFTLALEESKNLARFRRDRRISLEVLGTEDGIKSLIHRSSLQRRDGEGIDWDNIPFKNVNGRISSIVAAERGYIKLESEIEVFFNPARYGFEMHKDENASVSLGISFTYDGPVAHNVSRSV
ncbi:MAG: ATP-binding protein [Epsilonproteobacteria bacterium]|nr:ATP-binding protein [Campylobacterota bacterium]